MSAKIEEHYQESVVKRLNIVISLLIDLVKGDQSNRDKIKTLSDAGLDYREIASILNKEKNHVAVELSTMKKKRAAGAKQLG